MPSAASVILLALHVAAFIALLSTISSSTSALASPLPMPLLVGPNANTIPSMAKRKVDRWSEARTVHTASLSGIATASSRPGSRGFVIPGVSEPGPVAARGILDNLNLLGTYFDGAHTNALQLQGYAAQSSFKRNDDFDFQHMCAAALSSFHTNMLKYQTVLGELGADKGLASYDRQNDLETLLKNIVNLNKETLSYVNVLIYNIPTLGPILGPIVYDIKCLLDDILNAVENLTDAIVNTLKPLLEPLISKYTSTLCLLGLGINILGICL